MVDFDVCVVLPAGGTGERMCLPKPKQYCDVLSKPLLVFAMEEFHSIPWIKRIVLTVAKAYMEHVQGILTEHSFDKVTLAEGGLTRHRSIYLGINAISTGGLSPEVVIIHDAVRPFADIDLITQVTMAARTHGAAGVVRPLVSTVISTDSNGFLDESLDRSRYRASEMPQAFKFDIIRTAYQKSTDDDFDYGTECLHLALKYTGTKAKLIDGPEYLWKVTLKKDLYAAEGALKEKYIRVALVNCDDDVIEIGIKTFFTSRSVEVQCCSSYRDISAGINSVVYFHKNNDNNYRGDVVSLTFPDLVTHLHQNLNSAVFTSCFIVHVTVCEEGQNFLELHSSIHQQMTEASSGYLGTAICAVLTKTSSNQNKLTDLVGRIIWDRNTSLSGQVFIV